MNSAGEIIMPVLEAEKQVRVWCPSATVRWMGGQCIITDGKGVPLGRAPLEPGSAQYHKAEAAAWVDAARQHNGAS